MQAYHQCYLVYIPSCNSSSQTYLCFQKHYELELEEPPCHHLTVGEQLRISVLCTKRVSSSSFERWLCV